MKKVIWALALAVVGSATATAATRTALYQGTEVVAGEVLVTVDDRVHPAEIAEIAAREGLQVGHIQLDNGAALSTNEYVARAGALRPVRMIVLRFDPEAESMGAVLDRLRENPDITSAGPNVIVWANMTVNDPRFSTQWALPKIGSPAAWDNTTGSTNVLVAVVDTGVNYNHEDNSAHYRADLGKDYINNDNDPMDDNGHGTWCAGAIGAATNNGKGIAAVAPNVSIMGVKVLSASGSGSFAQVAQGIDHARLSGANVISLSLGAAASACNTPGSCDSTMAAVDAAWAANVFLACATGNDSSGTNLAPVGVPAKWDGCTAVGSTTSSNARSSFSNGGAEIDIVAPGSNTIGMYNSGYASLSGTSMATPHVAGVAALVFSKSATGTTGTAVRQRILDTAQTTGVTGGCPSGKTFAQCFGKGLVRADLATAP